MAKVIIPGENIEEINKGAIDDPLNPNNDDNFNKKDDDSNKDDNEPKKEDDELEKDDNDLNKKDDDLNKKDDLKDSNESDELIEGTEIDVEGEVYKINKDGDAVNDSGKVSYTKAQLLELYANEEEEADESNISIDDIMTSTKIQIFDEDGNQKKYDNSETAINEYVEDVYNKATKDGIEDNQSKLYNEFPFLPNLINHLRLGGDLQDFTKPTDYNDVKLDENNVNQLKTIIYKARSDRGEQVASIDRYYNYLLDSDTDNSLVLEEATRELKFLSDKQEELNRTQQENINSQNLKKQQNISNYWGVNVNKNGEMEDLNINNSVYSVIKNKKLKLGDNTFNIPDRIKIKENNKVFMKTPNDFFKYLYEPVVVTNSNGKRITTTKDNIKLYQESNNRNINNEIYDAFLRYVDYDKSQFINEQIKKDKVKKIIKLSRTRTKNGKIISNNNTNKRIVINK